MESSQGPCWLLINDFAITPCDPEEVRNLYGEQKMPCLLYYSRVSPHCWPAALQMLLPAVRDGLADRWRLPCSTALLIDWSSGGGSAVSSRILQLLPLHHAAVGHC